MPALLEAPFGEGALGFRERLVHGASVEVKFRGQAVQDPPFDVTDALRHLRN